MKHLLTKYSKDKSKSVEVSIGWVQGYTCAIAKMIELEGVVSSPIKDLYRAGAARFNEFDTYNIPEKDREILEKHKSELI